LIVNLVGSTTHIIALESESISQNIEKLTEKARVSANEIVQIQTQFKKFNKQLKSIEKAKLDTKNFEEIEINHNNQMSLIADQIDEISHKLYLLEEY
jgi:NAD-dependent SIR2 family protein deacetylase